MDNQSLSSNNECLSLAVPGLGLSPHARAGIVAVVPLLTAPVVAVFIYCKWRARRKSEYYL